MFYKLIRLLVLASAVLSLGMLVGLAFGYMGPSYAQITFQLILVSTSLFLFYQSRPTLAKNTLHKLINLIVHIAVIPLGIFAALCVTGESLATNYWFLINLVFVIFLTIALINIIAASGIKKGLKLLVIACSLVFAAMVLLQMSGKFNHGKILLASALAFTLLTIVAVIAAPRKKRSSQL